MPRGVPRTQPRQDSNTDSIVTGVPDGDGDGLTLARIATAAGRHARGPALTGEQEAAALAELAEAAGGRMDLLAQWAGLALGWHEHGPDAPVYLQVAQLCITAGADLALVRRWIEEGRRRRTAARQLRSPGLAA